MKIRVICLAAFIALVFTTVAAVNAQQTGFPPFGSFQNGQFDAVNLQNLNAHFSIPVIASSGRGLGLTMKLVYDSLVWQNKSGKWQPVTDSQGNPMWGWKTIDPIGMIYYNSQTVSLTKCMQDGQFVFLPNYQYSNFSYLGPLGTSHPFSSVSYTWY